MESPPAEGDATRIPDDWERLRRFLSARPGRFALGVARGVDHAQRRGILESVGARIEASGGRLLVWDASGTVSGSLLDGMLHASSSAALADADPVVVVGLDAALLAEAAPERSAFLRALNLERDRWRRELRRVVVLWLDPLADLALRRGAPDFVDYAESTFVFSANETQVGPAGPIVARGDISALRPRRQVTEAEAASLRARLARHQEVLEELGLLDALSGRALLRAGDSLLEIARAKREFGETDADVYALRAVDAYERAESRERAAVARELGGDILTDLYRWDEARTALEEARRRYRDLGDLQDEANCVFKLGRIALSQSNHPAARSMFDEALVMYRGLKDALGEANSFLSLADLALSRSDLEAARLHYSAALALYRGIGSALGEANSLQRLGEIALRGSDYEAAHKNFGEALERARFAGDARGTANSIQSLGEIALRRADHEGARASFEEALPLARQAGDLLGEANVVLSLAQISMAQSDLGAAQERLTEALPLYRRTGDLLGEANSLLLSGEIAYRQSHLELARELFIDARALYHRCGDILGEANSILSLGNLALDRAEPVAGDYYEEALPLFRRVGSILGEANCLQRLGDAALRRLDWQTAVERIAEALLLYRKIGNVVGEAGSIQRMGDMALRVGQFEAARLHYEAALPLFRRAGDLQGEANCIQGLGDIALARSDRQIAQNCYAEALALYERMPDPFSIGQTLKQLAKLASDPDLRRSLATRARATWMGIDRGDLVAQLDAEFEKP